MILLILTYTTCVVAKTYVCAVPELHILKNLRTVGVLENAHVCERFDKVPLSVHTPHRGHKTQLTAIRHTHAIGCQV